MLATAAPPGILPFSKQEPANGWLPVVSSTNETVPSFTLVFILSDSGEGSPKVLLGLKKRGFATGIYNGFGGKPLVGESVEECAIREVKEECGLSILAADLIPRGELTVVRPAPLRQPPIVANLYRFSCTVWHGEPKESEEMLPQWYDIGDLDEEHLPLNKMWKEQSIYLRPLLTAILQGKPHGILGRVDYESDLSLAGWWLAWEGAHVA